MNYKEAYAKLEQADQLHVLRYFDELNENEKNSLLEQIDRTDFSVIEACKKSHTTAGKGMISPLSSMELEEIEAKKGYFEEIGMRTIREGKVAAVLFAGGMGTRLGSDDPKGMYNIGITKDVFIFQRLIENLFDVVNASGTWLHLFVMTSDKNDKATRDFFAEKNYFGYKPELVHFFKQDMAPAADYDGHVYMESKCQISTSPNGNGGWYMSLKKAGLLEVIHSAGIEWLNIFAVDNVLQRIADPVFVGATVDSGVNVGAKVVRKNAPDEKVGVMCLEDGRPSIVEYTELTDELIHTKNENGEPAYNFGVILNYLFNVHAIETLFEGHIPVHVVEKKIPYLNETGELVKPEKPNGYKFEEFVFDMISLLKTCLPFEIVRNREFAPIKNQTGIDSVESARALCLENGIEL